MWVPGRRLARRPQHRRRTPSRDPPRQPTPWKTTPREHLIQCGHPRRHRPRRPVRDRNRVRESPLEKRSELQYTARHARLRRIPFPTALRPGFQAIPNKTRRQARSITPRRDESETREKPRSYGDSQKIGATRPRRRGRRPRPQGLDSSGEEHAPPRNHTPHARSIPAPRTRTPRSCMRRRSVPLPAHDRPWPSDGPGHRGSPPGVR